MFRQLIPFSPCLDSWDFTRLFQSYSLCLYTAKSTMVLDVKCGMSPKSIRLNGNVNGADQRHGSNLVLDRGRNADNLCCPGWIRYRCRHLASLYCKIRERPPARYSQHRPG